MNYERIYSDFIADRLTKQPSKPEYFEKHHILPKCKGGLNTTENMIRLTPEDHFFAHCCLAKIHGGKLWFVVMSMGHGWSRKNNSENLYSGRVMVGAARRRCAKMTSERMQEIVANGELGHFAKKGSDNVLHNPTLYRWINLDTGMKRESTIFDMHAEFGFSRPTWTSVQSGARKTVHGWAIEGSNIRIRGLKGKTFSFVNKDGRTFTGTQGEFCRHIGRSFASGTRVCRDMSVTACGWRLESTPPREFGNSKRTGKPAMRDNGDTFTLANDAGEVITGKRRQLSKIIGGTDGAFSAGIHLLKKGKATSHKGWRLVSIEQNIRQGKSKVAACNSIY